MIGSKVADSSTSDSSDDDDSKKPSATAIHSKREENAALAQLLVNESAIRTMLRSENLTSPSMARSGLMGSVSRAAALWVQQVLLRSTVAQENDDGKVEWSAIREAVQRMNTPLTKAIIEDLPTSIVVDKNKRRYLTKIQKGEHKKPKSDATSAPTRVSRAVKRDVKEAAATVASIESHHTEDLYGIERETLEIVEDEEDYD